MKARHFLLPAALICLSLLNGSCTKETLLESEPFAPPPPEAITTPTQGPGATCARPRPEKHEAMRGNLEMKAPETDLHFRQARKQALENLSLDVQ